MAKRGLSSFKGDTREIEPYELDLEDGSEPVRFKNPNKMKSREQFELAVSEDPGLALKSMLGEDYGRAWVVLGELESDRLLEILQDVREHFRMAAK